MLSGQGFQSAQLVRLSRSVISEEDFAETFLLGISEPPSHLLDAMGTIHRQRQELVRMGRNDAQIDRLECPSKQDAPNVEGRIAPNWRRVLLIERSQFAEV